MKTQLQIQKMLKEWPSNYHCPQSYGEPETVPFFQGKFEGKTGFQNDFKKLLGRPSTMQLQEI